MDFWELDEIVRHAGPRTRGPSRPTFRRRDDMHHPPSRPDHGDDGGCKFNYREIKTFLEKGGWKQFGKNFIPHIVEGQHHISPPSTTDYRGKIVVGSGVQFQVGCEDKHILRKGDDHYDQLCKELQRELLESDIWHHVKIINPAACIGYPQQKEFGDWSLDGELPFFIATTAYTVRARALVDYARKSIIKSGFNEEKALDMIKQYVVSKPETQFVLDAEQFGKKTIDPEKAYVGIALHEPMETGGGPFYVSMTPQHCICRIVFQVTIYVPLTPEYSKFYTAKQDYSQQEDRYQFYGLKRGMKP